MTRNFLKTLIVLIALGHAIPVAANGLVQDELPTLTDAGENYVSDAGQDNDSDEVEDDDADDDQYDANDDDTADIDTESTVDTAETDARYSLNGDIRALYRFDEIESRIGTEISESNIQSRLRIRGSATVIDGIQAGARVAWRCTTEDCGPDWYLDGASPIINGLDDGQATFDELFLHFFRQDLFNLTVGRQQTRFVLRGGLFARSLDRNDSNNVNVAWTDGFHATLRDVKGWTTHLILQHNTADGTGGVRRGQLDFSASSARRSYFIGLENTNAWGAIVQRSFDISYLPSSLLKDGTIDGRREDYWAFVGRLAARWPEITDGPRFRAGIEVGYAPERPTSSGAGIDTGVDGFAWNITASFMDFRPRHSIGVNFGQTSAGWLLSPNFRENENQAEIRYLWRPANFPVVDIRLRLRKEIAQKSGALQKQDALDGFVRLTWRFGR